MTRGPSLAVLTAFAASFLVVLLTPWCTRDRVQDPTAFVDAVRAAGAAGLVQAGDVVLVHPPWRDDVVKALRAASVLPAGARATTAVAPRGGEPLPPLVVVTDGGLPLPRALRALLAPAAGVRSLRHGPVEVLRLEAAAAAEGDDVTHDLAAALPEARVEIRPPGAAPVSCRWDAHQRRHACPGLPQWMYVGVQELPVAGARTQCVWAHPISGGAVSIRWARPLLKDELRLELALTDGAADNRAGAPVQAEILLDDASLARVTTIPGRRGFTSSVVPIDAPARAAHTLELLLTTPDDGQRHTCFRLTTMSTAGEKR